MKKVSNRKLRESMIVAPGVGMESTADALCVICRRQVTECRWNRFWKLQITRLTTGKWYHQPSDYEGGPAKPMGKQVECLVCQSCAEQIGLCEIGTMACEPLTKPNRI